MNVTQQDLAFQRDLFSLNKKNNLIEYRNVLIRATSEAEKELGEKIFDRAVIRFFKNKDFLLELKTDKDTAISIEVKHSLKRMLPRLNTTKIIWYYCHTSLYPVIQEFVLRLFVDRLFHLSLRSLLVHYIFNRQKSKLSEPIKDVILFKIEQTDFYCNAFKKFLISLLSKNSSIHKELKGI